MTQGDAGELVASWYMVANDGISSQVLHIYDASDDDEVKDKKVTSITPSTSSTNPNKVTISGLESSKSYYVKVENISRGGTYCSDGFAASNTAANNNSEGEAQSSSVSPKAAATWTITYDNNTTETVTGMPSSTTVLQSTKSGTLASDIPTRTGYTFLGWAGSSNATSADWQAGGTISNVTADKTIYAVWEKIDYTITLNQSPSAGATLTAKRGATAVAKANYQDVITLSVTDISENYEFVNWTSSNVTISSATSATGATFTMPAGDVTITANFQQVVAITWVNNGQTVGTTNVPVGTRPVIPAALEETMASCDDNSPTLYGWATDKWNGTAGTLSEVPAGVTVYKASSLPDATTEQTYYAVWAEGQDVDINSTLIAKWDKQSLTANTAVKAKDKDGNTLDAVTMTPNVTLSTSATYTYSTGSGSISSYPSIIITGFDLSDYDSGSMSFVLRGSQLADVQVSYSTDGSTYIQVGSDISLPGKYEYTYEITGIPKNSTHIKIYYSSNTGNFYFGTVRLYGVNSSPEYDFTLLNSSNTSGWINSDWDGYYIISGKKGEYSEYALSSGAISGITGTHVITPTSNTIENNDIGLIFKIAYSSENSGYSIQGLASGDYLGDATQNSTVVAQSLSPYYHYAINYNTIKLTESGNSIFWNYNGGTNPRFGTYGSVGSMAEIKLYKILATFSNFLTTCCDKNITLTEVDVTGGTVAYDQTSPLATCDGAKEVTVTITPSNGYQCTALSFTGGTPAETISVPFTHSDGAKEYTFTFAQNSTSTLTPSVTFEAMQDILIDRMHGQFVTTGTGIRSSGEKVGSRGITYAEGEYTMPTLTNTTETNSGDCSETHYYFVGWVREDDIEKDGTMKAAHTIISGGTTVGATGTTYYAIWAKEQ